MLYAYPREANTDNWMHECLCDILQTIHQNIEAGCEPVDWPAVIPNAHESDLKNRHGLEERLRTYARTVARLNSVNRQRVYSCLSEQNEIADLLACQGNCDSIKDLPEIIRKPVTDLFGFAYELLKDFGIRDNHYRIIYEKIPYKQCPFCGIEYFEGPNAPRPDLDHYLAKSIYPFAAANLWNLAPMGERCNEKYKLAYDILYDEAGDRRRSFNPYSHAEVRISLNNSQPFAGQAGKEHDWQIDFIPACEECTTWDNVFQIRERYREYVLDPWFTQWVTSFATWYKTRIGIATPSGQQLSDGLRQYVDDLQVMDLHGYEFLRTPVFRMLVHQCEQGNQKLLDWIRDLVAGAVV